MTSLSTEMPDIGNTITQFIQDLCTTFPELTMPDWWGVTEVEQNRKLVWDHCLQVYPDRFLDIVYENADIFLESSEVNTIFLPNIDFKVLWISDISDATKSTIWKYLQIIAISVMGAIKNKNELGQDSEKMFENMDSEDFQTKLQETMKNIQNMFPDTTHEINTDESSTEENNTKSDKKPQFNFENMQEHLETLMKGKIGQMAEELAKDLDIDLENMTDPTGVFKKFMNNPTKMMEVAKKCGAKMKAKMDSGEISEAELQSEIMGIMKAMNPGGFSGAGAGGMPQGMEGLKEMMAGMGLDMNALMKQFMGQGGAGGKGKQRMDVTKMNAAMQREDTRQRMKENLAKKQEQKEYAVKQATADMEKRVLEYKPMTDDEIAHISLGLAKNIFTVAEKPKKKNKKKK